MLQRSKSLPQVMEFAERRVGLVRIRGVRGVVPRIALGAAVALHDEQNSDEAESD